MGNPFHFVANLGGILMRRTLPHPVSLQLAWRHGLDGKTIAHQTPLIMTALGVVGLVAGVTLDVAKDLNLPIPAAGLIIVSTVVGAVGGAVMTHIHTEASKHNNALEEKLDDYCNTLWKGKIVESTSQAYLLGRAIHNLGYRLTKQIANEENEIDLVDICDGHTKQPVTKNDFKKMCLDYLVLSKLLVLADEAGLTPEGSDAEHVAYSRFVEPIRKGLRYMAKQAGEERDVVAITDGIAKRYRERVQGHGKTGLRRPVRRTRPEYKKLAA